MGTIKADKDIKVLITSSVSKLRRGVLHSDSMFFLSITEGLASRKLVIFLEMQCDNYCR